MGSTGHAGARTQGEWRSSNCIVLGKVPAASHSGGGSGGVGGGASGGVGVAVRWNTVALKTLPQLGAKYVDPEAGPYRVVLGHRDAKALDAMVAAANSVNKRVELIRR